MRFAVFETGSARPALWSQRQFDVVRMSALRQLKSRYRGTFLGVLWSFANPILMTVLYTALFGTSFSSYYGGSMGRYVSSAFVAIVLVTFFTQATAEALVSVVANGGLLNKIAVDAETFPLAAIAANTFQQSVTTFPAIIVLAAFLTRDPLHVVLTAVVLAGAVALVAGFSLALSALFVFVRDLTYLWSVISFVLWMTSPVFYPAALVPDRIRRWFEINPIGLSIAALRNVATVRGSVDLALVGKFLLVSGIVLVAGHMLFRAARRNFMDLL